MGSLPNLHELDKTEKEKEAAFKPGPALGHLCGGCNGVLTTEEKSKILHRYSGHARITKARSNPHDAHKIVYDDVMLEHMATYSPISTRSRYNLNFQSKRRDSMNSSIGATSVRRLLAVVRGGARESRNNGSPIYNKRVLISNLVVLCMSHLFSTAAFLPFMVLQGSVSIWTEPLKTRVGVNVNVGSLIMCGTFLVASFSSVLSPCFVKRLGSHVVIAMCYVLMIIFYCCHIYPYWYLTLPASILFGLSIGLLSGAHVSFLLTIGHRITSLFHDEEEESRQARKTCVIRRVARAFQGAHDFGLIIGSVLSAILITYTVNIKNETYLSAYNTSNTLRTNGCFDSSPSSPSSPSSDCFNTSELITMTSIYDYNSFLDEIFDRSEDGRLCGSQACPILYQTPSNFSYNAEFSFRIIPIKAAEILVAIYAGCVIIALLIAAIGMDNIKMLEYQDPMERNEIMAAIRAVRDAFSDKKLQMAAPLAIFIGVEQAFMYADFSKSYVVCTLGVHRLNLVFFAMGLLQSIAACTLSMLLRTIRRYYVVAVGFTFHSCLIMVLLVWKPIEDDPALFYVISASWGVCNAIWEMLNFTLLTGLYSDNWDSAFATVAFFKFFGFFIGFGCHSLMCNSYKLYFLAFLMLASVIPFSWLEIRLENMRKVKNITRL